MDQSNHAVPAVVHARSRSSGEGASTPAGRGLLVAVLIAAAGLALAGCTPTQYDNFQRQFREPADYGYMPIPNCDTPAEVAQIRDAKVRSMMQQWLDLREQYLVAWRKGGEHDDLVQRIRNRRATLRAVIEDRADQLAANGQPIM